MTSHPAKSIVRNIINDKIADGAERSDIAAALGLPNDNYISMLISKKDKSLLSLNRLPALAAYCELDERTIMRTALARVAAAEGRPIEMTPDTFHFLLKTFAKLAARNCPSLAELCEVPA